MRVIDHTHPWYPAAQDFENHVLPFLKAYGKQIGDDAKTNCTAQKIIDCYTMLYRSFDPVTLEVLKDNLTLWVEENKSTNR